MSTAIEWTDETWNPVTGCTKVSAGCDNCYAERVSISKRMAPFYPRGFELMLRPERLQQPARWRKGRRVFVNSMSDLFHKDIPRHYVDRVFDVMDIEDRHVYQVLTKRGSLMRDYINDRYGTVPAHIWLGVSIEDQQAMVRLDHLQRTRAVVRFLSLEPLLGRLASLNLWGISWVIVGGESGPGARPLQLDWVREIRDRCVGSAVPFFFKQVGGYTPKSGGRMLDGRTWDEEPRSRCT